MRRKQGRPGSRKGHARLKPQDGFGWETGIDITSAGHGALLPELNSQHRAVALSNSQLLLCPESSTAQGPPLPSASKNSTNVHYKPASWDSR